MTMRNDDERFEAIYRKHFARIYRYFRFNKIADGEAQDLAQDTFLRFFERIDQLRGADEGPFLRAIARTVLLNYIRAAAAAKRRAPMVFLDDPDAGVDPPAPEIPDYADRQQQKVRQASLRQARAALPAAQRLCLDRWLDGDQYNEIARDLGITMDAVKTRIKNAKKFLSVRLGEAIPEDDQ